ncbi:cation diffusion facilitator family transporter [Clostridium botulinum]|uniref:Cation diffusion facilitator family transporter n=1 Tax=Clostridium botulinum TaxID=1491 RepID=A0A9Q1V0I9_CLOBO|nr:cation diffusion facilitator family transporter [Clostridium botulinum]AEB75188.1 cation efflux family protein [Clostridium botulinum BKT015925]KEI05430.1 cation diffusion facilitator family transporter [Clostridium botulinum C/D str. Sp77]KOA80716.1 cation diffusion facilitator family transporter [Clostridium botulinum]KOA83454.1 cation diffusion facilitator family transporter [Clostridium botulinum]KOA90315.1 cation diffusion facilitator family transporter [Clostridium botulinum]
MLSKFLVSKFINDHENINNPKVRDTYGYLGGIVGVIINIFLFLLKLSIGVVVKSIAVTADAFNNLSDALSSIITIVGFKMASKPADKEHPFGHGRIEYLSGLIVAFMVMLVGFQFTKSSFSRITNPEKVYFQPLPFILLLVSILAKIWLCKFNKYIGIKINSSALQASALDALGDVITSSTVALSFLLSKWIDFPIDAYIGILVSLFILYSGFSLVKDTINPLLGEAPNPEFIKQLEKDVMSYKNISGVHDIIIHNYGPGRIMGSLHAEVPCDISIVKIHEIIDKAEKELSEKYSMFLVIHMDPINTNDKDINSTKNYVETILKSFSDIISFHDFRMVGEGEYKNLIFDIVVKTNFDITANGEDLCEKIDYEIKKLHPNFNAIITIDKSFC